ncbi:MAG TPA: caspase family protein [Acidisarcina sp.]
MSETKSALIVASWEYRDADLRQLVAPANDAEALARVLSDPAMGGFDVQTVLNKTSREMSEEIESFFLNRKRDDLLLLYFSGHGVKDDDGQLYFTASDTRLIDHSRPMRSTAVSAEFIREVMRCSKSRRQVLILDCCYSGAFASAMMAKGDKSVGVRQQFDQGRGMVIMTASDALQYSFEGDKVEGEAVRSVFTSSMVRGIETGQADLDCDGNISLDELYDYIYAEVAEHNSDQRPRKWTLDIEGRIIVAQAPIREAELPGDLLSAINSPLPRVREGAAHALGDLLAGDHRGLVLAARQALTRMLNDDSRLVSRQAEALLAPDKTLPAVDPIPDMKQAAPLPPPGKPALPVVDPTPDLKQAEPLSPPDKPAPVVDSPPKFKRAGDAFASMQRYIDEQPPAAPVNTPPVPPPDFRRNSLPDFPPNPVAGTKPDDSLAEFLGWLQKNPPPGAPFPVASAAPSQTPPGPLTPAAGAEPQKPVPLSKLVAGLPTEPSVPKQGTSSPTAKPATPAAAVVREPEPKPAPTPPAPSQKPQTVAAKPAETVAGSTVAPGNVVAAPARQAAATDKAAVAPAAAVAATTAVSGKANAARKDAFAGKAGEAGKKVNETPKAPWSLPIPFPLPYLILGALIVFSVMWWRSHANSHSVDGGGGKGGDKTQQQSVAGGGGQQGTGYGASTAAVVLRRPPFDYASSAMRGEDTKVRLTELSETRNQITDEDTWFSTNGLALPTLTVPNPAKQQAGNIPSNIPTKFGDNILIHAIQQGDQLLCIYGASFATGRYLISYDLASSKTNFSFDFDNYLLPPKFNPGDRDLISEGITWAWVEDGTLYVSNSHNTYAKTSYGLNAYLNAIDLMSGNLIWRSAPLLDNASTFLLYKDAIIAGYGFSAENHFLYVLNKSDGRVAQTIKLRKSPEYILSKGDTIYVRTYDTDYVFEAGPSDAAPGTTKY